eukprot:13550456-Alexandrium_andersonii.AAC.1
MEETLRRSSVSPSSGLFASMRKEGLLIGRDASSRARARRGPPLISSRADAAASGGARAWSLMGKS